uniref:Uncharacterized protein n=1 Tax=Escherichia coli TaxID=562 RepID=A0A811ARS3_ECOLX|nr:hypothetical protein [Escherichia coli]
MSAYRTRRDTGNGNLPDIESRIQKAANRYEETVQKALPADNAETERREQLKSYLTTYGWVAPGARYQTFATANQRLEDSANRAPTVSGVSSLGEAGDTEFLKEVKGLTGHSCRIHHILLHWEQTLHQLNTEQRKPLNLKA